MKFNFGLGGINIKRPEISGSGFGFHMNGLEV